MAILYGIIFVKYLWNYMLTIALEILLNFMDSSFNILILLLTFQHLTLPQNLCVWVFFISSSCSSSVLTTCLDPCLHLCLVILLPQLVYTVIISLLVMLLYKVSCVFLICIALVTQYCFLKKNTFPFFMILYKFALITDQSMLTCRDCDNLFGKALCLHLVGCSFNIYTCSILHGHFHLPCLNRRTD